MMLPGPSGFRWIPRKMAGIAMMTIDPSIVAIVMLSVVLDSAIHLYLSDCPADSRSSGCRFEVTPTLNETTANSLLDHNYLVRPAAGPAAQRLPCRTSRPARAGLTAVTRAMVNTQGIPSPARHGSAGSVIITMRNASDLPAPVRWPGPPHTTNGLALCITEATHSRRGQPACGCRRPRPGWQRRSY